MCAIMGNLQRMPTMKDFDKFKVKALDALNTAHNDLTIACSARWLSPRIPEARTTVQAMSVRLMVDGEAFLPELRRMTADVLAALSPKPGTEFDDRGGWVDGRIDGARAQLSMLYMLLLAEDHEGNAAAEGRRYLTNRFQALVESAVFGGLTPAQAAERLVKALAD